MSHFAVLVMSRKEELGIDNLLYKYSEHIDVLPYISKTKEEMAEEFRERVKDQFNFVEKEYNEKKKALSKAETEEFESKLATLKNLMDRVFDNDEKCYKKYIKTYGIKPEDLDSKGNLLSTYNPDSKWDWYEIGGRFSGKLKTKSGENVDDGYAEDLNLERNEEKYNKALKWWDINISKTVEGEEDKYRYKDEYYLSFYKDRETFADIHSRPIFRAVITPDGVWHEKGKMGWWGMSSESAEDSLKWDLGFYENFLTEAIENNYYLTVVDCHI